MSDGGAPIGDSTQEYLSAEEAAQELVAALRELREATEGYISAEKRLGDVGKRLAELADATQQSGEKVSAAAEAVRSVSGPGILAQIKAGQEALDSVSENLEQRHALVLGAFATQSTERAAAEGKGAAALAALARQLRTVTYLSAAAAVFAIAALIAVLAR